MPGPGACPRLACAPVPIPSRLRSLAPLAVVLLLALFPIFYDLGGPPLWDDEADTVVFARRIVETGLPIAWDGRMFLDSDSGLRVAPRALGHDFVMVGTPWLPFYATAASFAMLGVGTAPARLPFAIAALATIALLYAFVLRATGCRRAALAAAILLPTSTQFLLYARESRSYAFNMLFTVVVLWCFVLLRDRAQGGAAASNGRGARFDIRAVGLVVAAVLLFHSQIMPAAIAIGTCALLALFHPRFRPRLGALLRLAPWVMLFTLPWIALTWSETHTNWMPLESAGALLQRIAQLGAESTVAIPWLGWIVGLLLLRDRFTRSDRDLLAIGLCYVALSFALLPLALPKLDIFMLGIRYVCALIPVAVAVTAVLVARASNGHPLRYVALLLVFGATHLAGNALPWLALGETVQVVSRDGPVVSVPRERSEKLLNLQLWQLLRGLGTPGPGTMPRLAAFVTSNTEPDDIVLTNFGWDWLYYYTDRRQAYRISPEASALRSAAREVGLPSYVTSLDGVDWLVWRHAAAPLPGLSYDEARAQLEARGARLESVAQFRDILWENRPELHWHRFPGVGLPFAPRRFGAEGPAYPDAVVYRVRWPDAASDDG